ncbi:MAG: hypothetical protein NZ838_03170 [Candidatus Marinimicrobia bacterium]|jgi:hypothetical protein|nr:hypothetical protein [Candidatus Neomarinimicrobiota bacterium]|tara:strand:- start:401 stop:1870 length:1470 start_codon:yes stop_codon:yes gene_type:complete
MHTEKYFILIICFFIWTCSQDDGPEDCLGVAGGSAELDSCGVCDDDPANDCTQDCAGIWGGGALLDDCETCDDDPSNDCTEDCAGVPGGNAVLDSCGVCDDDTTNDCTQDCLGIWGGNDICGCTDPEAINFNELATFDDGSCQYDVGELNVQWVKTYEDIGDESWCVRQVSDGGFIIAGASNYMGLLIKTDSGGDVEWHQTYENSTALYSARETSDGGFIAVGYYECDTLPGCYPDIYLLKTDGSGIIDWEKYDGTSDNNDWARDVIQTQDDFVVTGTWNDNGNNSKAMLRKYSSTGELIWDEIYSSSAANEINSMLETSDGDFILAGYTGTQHGDYKALLIKTDPSGQQIWKKNIQSIGSTELYAICESPNGGYIGAGYCNSWRSNYLVERNANGGGVWNDCHVVEPSVSGYYDITPSSNGGYYLIDDNSVFTWVNAQGEIIFSQDIEYANMSIMELDGGDIVVGGYGFIDGNSGGTPALMRLSFSNQ